ncbi:MAG: glycosyltransferase [Oscillospiraceae bacterium]|jgi:dolichyl-phosphate beta-glucosyltransferase|nr:glycosyltransferase [Oscillospiraceae bacterium]
MKISLILPAYNESEIIRANVLAARAFLTESFPDFELIVVDDGSTDATPAIVSALQDNRVRVISYPANRGKGHAVRTGVLSAVGDLVFYTDADLAYGFNPLTEAVQAFAEHPSDLVIGSRRLSPDGYGEYSALRIFTSRLFALVARVLSGSRYDTQCGFKGFTRDAAQAIFSRCKTDGFAFDFEVVLLADALNLQVAQLPVKILHHGTSSVRLLRDSVRMLLEIRRIRRRVNNPRKESRS